MIATNLKIRDGVLEFAGFSTPALARKYGTPLYLMDEQRIRDNCRMYQTAMTEYFGENALTLYASKALSFKRMYEIVSDEGLGIDVVSSGEIHTAAKAGFPMEKAFFHGNNKTDEDIAFAMDRGVGYFVVDNVEELYAIEHIAERKGITQKCLLRVTPGIDPHTYDAVATGKVDSKFGVPIETGQAEEFYNYAAALSHLEIVGLHCHVGSMVFDEDVYERTAQIMLEFMAKLHNKYGFVTQFLDLGGGYGVRYRESEGVVDIAYRISALAEFMKELAAQLKLPLPRRAARARTQHRRRRGSDDVHRRLRQAHQGLQKLRLRGRRHDGQPALRALPLEVHRVRPRAHGGAADAPLRRGRPLLRERRHHPAGRLAAGAAARRSARRVHHGRVQLRHGLALQPHSARPDRDALSKGRVRRGQARDARPDDQKRRVTSKQKGRTGRSQRPLLFDYRSDGIRIRAMLK